MRPGGRGVHGGIGPDVVVAEAGVVAPARRGCSVEAALAVEAGEVTGGVLHVIDDTCTPDALLELSALGPAGRDVVCVGPLPVWCDRSLSVCRLPRPNRWGVRQAGGIARRYAQASAGRKAIQCWSVRAASAFWAGVSYVPLRLLIRLTELPGRDELGLLIELNELAWPEVVCAAEADAAELRAAAGRLAVRVIPPATLEASGSPADRPAAREGLGIRPEEFVILAGGAVRRGSGHRMAVWAADILHVAGVPVRLLVQSAGPALKPLEEFLERVRFRPRVRFVGPEVSVSALLAAADVVVLLQRRSFPAALLACAARAGLPVVAASEVGRRWGLSDGRDALLAPGGDPRRIAQALLRLVERPELRSRLGRAGHRGWAGFQSEALSVHRRWAELYAAEGAG